MNELRIKIINRKIKKCEKKIFKNKIKIEKLKMKRYAVQCDIDLKEMRLRRNEREKNS